MLREWRSGERVSSHAVLNIYLAKLSPTRESILKLVLHCVLNKLLKLISCYNGIIQIYFVLFEIAYENLVDIKKQAADISLYKDCTLNLEL